MRFTGIAKDGLSAVCTERASAFDRAISHQSSEVAYGVSLNEDCESIVSENGTEALKGREGDVSAGNGH